MSAGLIIALIDCAAIASAHNRDRLRKTLAIARHRGKIALHNSAWERFVPRTLVISIGLCLLWPVAPAAAAATTPAVTAKPAPQAPSQATIYFLRPNGIVGLGAPDILIDGQKVGELSPGTYFVVNRPPGHYTIESQGSIFHTSWQSEVDFAAGQIYFLEIGPQTTGAPGSDLLNMIFTSTSGRQLPGHGLFNYVFYSLDAEHGRAEIAKLKK
jgi:hypothetical protein